MFTLIQKANMDKCYRCSGIIENENDLSIDHKKEWMYSDNAYDLFFDIDNIAFSHKSCNSAHRRKGIRVYSNSGYKGVCFRKNDKNKKKWSADICVNGKAVFIGRFDKPEIAAKAYDEKAIEFFGDKAITNKMLRLI
jgi:hypothetical protein